jgi:hypothetical protein
MPLEQKFQRVEPGSPNQCQAIAGQGQCHFAAVPGFKFCPMHHGQEQASDRRAKLHQYRMGKWQARVEEFETHENVKSLRSEVGVLKMLLEETVSKCESSMDLLMASSKISDIIDKIHRLVPTMQKMEQNAGITLDKNAVLQLADVIVTIMADYIEDGDDKALAADRIIQAIVEAKPAATTE